MEQTNQIQNHPESAEQPLALSPSAQMRVANDVAAVCGEIVKKTAISIQGKQYIRVEGWESIACAYGCVAGSRDVERTPDGYRAVGELRRIQDGVLIATSEGFVGTDEIKWFGGEKDVWDKVERQMVRKTIPKRDDYAIRAMAQTRAISRVCRSAFAHVVVLIDASLSTTPAEEIPDEGFVNHTQPTEKEIVERQERREAAQAVSGTHQSEQDLVDAANLAFAEAATPKRKKKSTGGQK